MQAFRSEGELERWCRLEGRSPGAVFAPSTLWRLARAWYDDRLDLAWSRRTVRERQTILTRLGLVGEAWRIE
ncbi:MAG: alkylmercury lyase family protein [Holophagales bacterium]|nr:alkylmercury lyase family protein [Holophagales bacterium]